jgi:hypothetical protein
VIDSLDVERVGGQDHLEGLLGTLQLQRLEQRESELYTIRPRLRIRYYSSSALNSFQSTTT